MFASSIDESQRKWPLTGRVVAAICAWWLLYSLLYAWSNYLLGVSAGRDPDAFDSLRFGLNVGLPFILPTCLLWWVVMRYPLEQGNAWWRTGLYAVAMLVASLLRIAMREVHYLVLPTRQRPPTGDLLHEVSIQISLNFMWFLALVLIAYGWSYFQRAQRQRLRILQMEGRVAQSRLEALRAQLNPHFLFNALNSVAEMVHRDPVVADHMLVALSTLLRDRLGTDDAPQRALAEELALVRDYLAIEQMRLGERLQVDWRVDADAMAMQVPALSVQVLVENAIVHAIAKRRAPSRLAVRAWLEGEQLRIAVGNTLSPDAPPTPGHGIGLASVTERLRLIHGEAARVERTVGEQGSWHLVELSIPAAPAPGKARP
ncbi:MAG: histidine kinase [Pseudoxanthomonas suwonensis]|nr:histidine kinase [Pseudoxanthomonas suwonensis]